MTHLLNKYMPVKDYFSSAHEVKTPEAGEGREEK